MSKFGKKFTCWSCGTKFYDLNKPGALCPKCGANPDEDPNKDKPVAAGAPFADEYADEPEEIEEEALVDEDEAEEDVVDDGGADADEY
jgi:uncharacterized protein (TIGR02300 family)